MLFAWRDGRARREFIANGPGELLMNGLEALALLSAEDRGLDRHTPGRPLSLCRVTGRRFGPLDRVLAELPRGWALGEAAGMLWERALEASSSPAKPREG
jgi:hypothetical protein